MRERVMGLSLGLLLGACRPASVVVPGRASPTAIVEPAPPSPAQSARASVDEAAPAPAEDARPLDEEPAVGAPEPKTAPPRVLLEAPYSAHGHPRLATEMLTLGRDEELFQWALGGTSDPAHPSNQLGYHPATRVVVEVQLLSRAPKGTTRRLERIARSTGYWPLRSCFETAQRIAEKADRSAKVRVSLSASGKVLGTRLVGRVTERDYARCVVKKIGALDFTPGFTRKLDIEISVKQWPGHAPVPPRAPDAEPTLRLGPEATAALAGTAPAIQACYENALKSDPKLWGRIALRVRVTNSGSVQEATPVETRFPNSEVVECARQAVRSARLDSSRASEFTFAVRLGQGAGEPAAPDAGAPASPVEGAPPEPLPPAPH